MVQFVVYTNQSIFDCSTGTSRLDTVGCKGPDGHLILYNWLIPNCNVHDGISIVISLVRGAGVKSTKGL